jgi:hypothetical protein
MKKILIILILLTLPSLASARDIYVSPGGSGSSCILSSPCKVATALNKVSAGDTVLLMDGIYRGADSMVKPPQGKSGSKDNPITIRALNEGEALIDGQNARGPVILNNNNWFELKGFNACCSSQTNIGVVVVSNSDNIAVRRVVAWDAGIGGNANTGVFKTTRSNNILFEDCAGWGNGRKIFSNWYCNGFTVRRGFGRFTFFKSTLDMQGGITLSYGSTDTLIENSIATWDEYPSWTDKKNNPAPHFDDSTAKGTSYRSFGNIAYLLSSQNAKYRHPKCALAYAKTSYNGAAIQIKDFLSYVSAPDINSLCWSYNDIKTGKHITLIGGGNGFQDDAAAAVWGTVGGTFDNVIQQDSTDIGVSRGSNFDYIMFWNNKGANWKGSAPAHYTTGTNPNLVGRCGDILQYGCSEAERPKVNGHSVGAQIKYRYIDGVLTDDPLWPWPMNERIKEAMILSGYDKKGGLDGKGGIDLTKVVFELGGGTMPDFGLPSCDCTAWQDSQCGVGGCSSSQIQQTRTCTPSGCLSESQCIGDPSCGGPLPNTYSVEKTQTPPSIDGNTAEFSGTNKITLSNSHGTKGTYRLMWDNNALYIAAEVEDSHLNADRSERDQEYIWWDDSIEIMIDTLHDGGNIKQDDYKFFVNLLNNQADSRQLDLSWSTPFTSSVTYDGSLNDNTDDDAGYTIEVAIPWSGLGIPFPSVGETLGFELMMNDQDDSDTRIAEVWANLDGGDVNNPGGWGKLVFVGEEQIPTYSIEVEAESGSLSSPMSLGSDSSASGGQYVSSGTGFQGSASFSFDVQKPGRFRLEARVLTPSSQGAHDSFFIGKAGQTIQGNNTLIWDTIQTGTWAWDLVSQRGPGGDNFNADHDPKLWDLVPGTHSFEFHSRESDTRLDKVRLVRACHRVDHDCQGCVIMGELVGFLDFWKSPGTDIAMPELMEAIGLWKGGIGCI